MQFPYKHFPKVIGHRGACGYAPENTLASMHKAKELGVEWVEFDVMLTQDGEAIIIHDNNVNRTSNSKGEVAKLSYAAIKQLDAGSWFSKDFSNEKIPSFIELIECLCELNLNANIEIKPYPGFERETAIKTVELIHEHWPKDKEPPLVSSFSSESLFTARQIDKELVLGVLLHRWQANWQHYPDELDAVTVHVNQKILRPKYVEAIKASNR